MTGISRSSRVRLTSIVHDCSVSNHPSSRLSSNPEFNLISDSDSDCSSEEDPDAYDSGGYHSVRIGETFKDGRYIAERKLGWGNFSTVWMARDTQENRWVAIKIVRGDEEFADPAYDEIKIMAHIQRGSDNHPGKKYVCQFYDYFEHEGPNGVHVCIVMQILGQSLTVLLKRCLDAGSKMGPIIVKQVAKQTLLALDYLHRECGVIHTDLKPDNLLVVVDDVDKLVSQIESQEALKKQESVSRNNSVSSASTGLYDKNNSGNDSNSSSALSLPKLKRKVSRKSRPLYTPLHANSRSPLFSPFLAMTPFVKKQGNTNGPESITSLNTANSDSITNLPRDSPLNGNSGTRSPVYTPNSYSYSSFDDHNKSYVLDHPNFLPKLESIAGGAHEATFDVQISINVADLGNASWIGQHLSDEIQTRPYRAPEIIIGAPWGAGVDMWSMGCIIFELMTGDLLFDPIDGETYSKEDDHLAQIIETLGGNYPLQFIKAGSFYRDYFDYEGKLRNVDKLKQWLLKDVLVEKYKFSEANAVQFTNFLTPFLRILPEDRADAGGMANHKWLQDAKGLEDITIPGRKPGESGKDIPGWTDQIYEEYGPWMD